MGGSSSKEDSSKSIEYKPKTGDIKINSGDLPKLALVNLNVAKPPTIKTGAELKRDKEREQLKDLVEFDLSKEFD